MSRVYNNTISSEIQNALLLGYRYNISAHKVSEILGISVNTVKKYWKKNGLKTFTISESLYNHQESKRNNFADIESYKLLVSHLIKEHNTEPVSQGYCKGCGYTVDVIVTDIKCPKCGMYKMMPIEVCSELVAEHSIH